MGRIAGTKIARLGVVLCISSALVVGISASAGAGTGGAKQHQAAATGGVVVQAGINDPKDPNIAITEFLPAKVTVAVGETLTWDWAGAIEPHSVTFFPAGQEPPAPGSDEALFLPTPPTGAFDGTTLMNSGLQPLGPGAVPPFSMTFAKPGDFTYHCVIHPGMIGDVTVVAEGGTTDTAKAVKARGKAEEAKWVAEGRAAKAKLKKPSKPVKNSDGTKTWTVQMGTTTAHTDILAFAPSSRNIVAGDTVDFVNNSQAPHTATFSGDQPAITNPLDPQTDTAIPGPSPQTLNATDLFNTAELAPKAGSPPPPLAARSFEFVVPTAGKYAFYCILHTLSGMGGDIVAK